jgi:hypothetical protein
LTAVIDPLGPDVLLRVGRASVTVAERISADAAPMIASFDVTDIFHLHIVATMGGVAHRMNRK